MRAIAIVDDDDTFLTITAKSINKLCDVEVRTYHRGECLMRALCAGFEPDAIIMDEHLDGEYGHEVVAILREWGYQGAVVCVSSDFHDMTREDALALATKCVQAGASFVMGKFDPRQICLRLRDATDTLVKLGRIPVQGNRRVG
jgi:DNA-binding NarL/FixJ family response regulator